MEGDEEETRARLRGLHAELNDPRIAADGGRIVTTTGDGILVESPSAVDAVRNTLAIQTAMAGPAASLPPYRRITFRVGVNVDDSERSAVRYEPPVAIPRQLKGGYQLLAAGEERRA